jgi:hypothetical protein
METSQQMAAWGTSELFIGWFRFLARSYTGLHSCPNDQQDLFDHVSHTPAPSRLVKIKLTASKTNPAKNPLILLGRLGSLSLYFPDSHRFH